MKLVLKYISFFVLLINGYGQLYSNSLEIKNDINSCGFLELEQHNEFNYFDDSDALIHENSNSIPEKKFSETEEIEIEEAQNDSEASKKYLQSSDPITALFYSFISAYYYYYYQSDKIPSDSNINHNSSYPSICVRFCVFRL